MSTTETIVDASDLRLACGEWPQTLEYSGFSYTFVGFVRNDEREIIYGLYGCSYGPVLKVFND